MTRMNVTEARDNFSDLINRVAYGSERVCLARSGKDVACVVSVEEARLLELIEDRIDLEDAMEALAEVQSKGTIAWDDLRTEIGI